MLVGYSRVDDMAPRTDRSREDRITREIVVDAYNEGEVSLSWYYYLEGKLQFPFKAKCVARREISPLEPGEAVEVVEMASDARLAVSGGGKRRGVEVPNSIRGGHGRLWELQNVQYPASLEGFKGLAILSNRGGSTSRKSCRYTPDRRKSLDRLFVEML